MTTVNTVNDKLIQISNHLNSLGVENTYSQLPESDQYSVILEVNTDENAPYFTFAFMKMPTPGDDQIACALTALVPGWNEGAESQICAFNTLAILNARKASSASEGGCLSIRNTDGKWAEGFDYTAVVPDETIASQDSFGAFYNGVVAYMLEAKRAIQGIIEVKETPTVSGIDSLSEAPHNVLPNNSTNAPLSQGLNETQQASFASAAAAVANMAAANPKASAAQARQAGPQVPGTPTSPSEPASVPVAMPTSAPNSIPASASVPAQDSTQAQPQASVPAAAVSQSQDSSNKKSSVLTSAIDEIGKQDFKEALNDVPDIAFIIVSFLIPIVGLVVYFMWKDEKPELCKRVLTATIAGFVVGFMMLLIW